MVSHTPPIDNLEEESVGAHFRQSWGVMNKLEESRKRADSSIPMLLTAATVCILFMLIAGGLVYGNTRRTITAANWVEHTQEVMNSLRTASQMSERVESSAELYLI